jgi:Mg2+-importing ATPase
MGPVSSIFDILCFAVMWWIIGADKMELAPLFHCGWFIFGTLSQVTVIHMIRTAKLPFLQSRASKPLLLSTFVMAVIALTIAFTGLAAAFNMTPLPASYIPWLAAILIGYLMSVQLAKRIYIRRHGEWM